MAILRTLVRSTSAQPRMVIGDQDDLARLSDETHLVAALDPAGGLRAAAVVLPKRTRSLQVHLSSREETYG